MKKCVICGEYFEPKHNAQRICNNQHYRKCKFCGKEFPINRPSDSKQCCSKECTEKLREKTMVDRYGVTHALKSDKFLKKSEETQLARYGVKHASQNKDVKAKAASTFLSKYGVTTPFLMSDFQSKSRETCLERYGVEFTSQIPGRTERVQETNLRKYGSKFPLGNKDIADKLRYHMTSKYGVPYYCMTDECRSKQKQTISSVNKLFMSKLSEIGIYSEPESVKLDRYSYDVFIPDLNTVVEINPTDTHNIIKNPWADVGLPREYHYDKTKRAVEAGYRCMNIWDWDSMDKVVHSLSSDRIVYARNCKVSIIDQKTANMFETMYHFQSKVRGQSVCLGLYSDGELVQVMTFGKPRYNSHYEYELLRLCTRFGTKVVGGSERLWTAFIKMYSPKSVISYCDLSKFKGDVYFRLGMELECITPPNKLWSKGNRVVTNNLLLQRGYDQLFGTDFGKGTCNETLMLDSGWLPIYDCGQAVYVYMNPADLR